MPSNKQNDQYEVILPKKGRGLKEIKRLLKGKKKQIKKAIKKLQKFPVDISHKDIEKLRISELGKYSIRVSGGDRIFYDVDTKNKKVYLLRAGKHDLYKLLR